MEDKYEQIQIQNQNLVAIHDVSFLVVQLSYKSYQTCNFETKLVFWYSLTTFPHKRGSFALFDDVFKKINQNRSLHQKCL